MARPCLLHRLRDRLDRRDLPVPAALVVGHPDPAPEPLEVLRRPAALPRDADARVQETSGDG